MAKIRTTRSSFEGKVTRPEILKIPELRISSASLARIRDQKGRYALLVNKNRAQKGEVYLTPIGGAIEADEEGIKQLKEILGLKDAAFEKGNDLRFRMEGMQANTFREWFLSNKGRETNPLRELGEELIEEAQLLDPTDLERLMEASYSLAGYATELAETNRTGQEGQITLRLLEIFDIVLDEEILERLSRASHKSYSASSTIRFVTEEELRCGVTEDGIQIGEVAKTLINPQPTIEVFE